MQDALGRESGRLPNLIGICWLIAWLWLTRYPVVLCKQDNIAGKSGRACTPCGALFLCFSSSGCSKEKKKLAPLDWTSITALPSSLKWSKSLKVSKYNYPLFFPLLQQPSLNQLCACHYLKKSRLFHFGHFVKLLENFKYAPSRWKKCSSLCLTFRRGKICRFWQQEGNKTPEVPPSTDLLQGQICCTTH